METTLSRKMTRMHELEKEKHILPEKDLYDNIETAIKGAVYMNYRHLYNNAELALSNGALHCALFFLYVIMRIVECLDIVAVEILMYLMAALHIIVSLW